MPLLQCVRPRLDIGKSKGALYKPHHLRRVLEVRGRPRLPVRPGGVEVRPGQIQIGSPPDSLQVFSHRIRCALRSGDSQGIQLGRNPHRNRFCRLLLFFSDPATEHLGLAAPGRIAPKPLFLPSHRRIRLHPIQCLEETGQPLHGPVSGSRSQSYGARPLGKRRAARRGRNQRGALRQGRHHRKLPGRAGTVQPQKAQPSIGRPRHRHTSIQPDEGLLDRPKCPGQGQPLGDENGTALQPFHDDLGPNRIHGLRARHHERRPHQPDQRQPTEPHRTAARKRKISCSFHPIQGPLHRERNGKHPHRGARCPAPHCSKSAHAPDP